MSTVILNDNIAQRRVESFERQHGKLVLLFAGHAALSVAFNSELIHLLRINFFMDPPEELTPDVEANLLLSTLCREIGDDLYEMDTAVRNLLLKQLARDYTTKRLRDVAQLLWEYTEETKSSPWGNLPRLERAQKLTALNFLDPDKANEWLAQANESIQHGVCDEEDWIATMRVTLHETVNAKELESLNQLAIPDISLQLLNDFYYPDDYTHEIEVHFQVHNAQGRAPAEFIELFIQEDLHFFNTRNPRIQLDKSLRGGESKIFSFRVELTTEGIHSDAFSIAIGGHYRSRTKNAIAINTQSFTIRLLSENVLKPIMNPYVRYSEGGPVDDRDMFFGREDIIRSIVQVISGANRQSKLVIVYGQKRVGVSTVLYWLEKSLREYPNILVLNIGNIVEMINPNSHVPLFYQILNGILSHLKNSVEEKELSNGEKIGIVFPESTEFYEHPNPIVYFREIFDIFRRTCLQHQKWHHVHIVLLIDEFNYIYDLIIQGKIPETFMKIWKSLLQSNYFSAVIFGQDVMAKFRDRFPNELGSHLAYRLTYLGYDDARDLIDIPIRIDGRDGESRFRGQSIERILELTGGSPYYIQIVCSRLVQYINEKRAQFITDADIERVKEKLIRGRSALTMDRFDNLFNSGDYSADAISNEDTIQVLRQIAYNSQLGPCHHDSISCKTVESIDLILNDLTIREVISEHHGRFYSIRVGLLKEWLLTH